MFLSNTIGQKLDRCVSTHSLNLVRICEKGSSHSTLERMRKHLNEAQNGGGHVVEPSSVPCKHNVYSDTF